MNNINYLTIPEGDVDYISVNGIKIWERAHIYGVSWAGGTSATMTRTDDAANFSSPVIGTGSTAGSSPFDNCYPWNKMEAIFDGTHALVSIPKFWYKWSKSGSTMKLQIADKPVYGFSVSPMHADRGDGKGERDIAYIGRYKCSSSYYSASGQAPVASITIGTARSKIKALGDGFYQQDYASFWTVRMLFLVEWATWDGQSVLQNTSNWSAQTDVVTGGTYGMAYHTGVSSNGYSIQYRHIEDPWENVLEWVDGLYFSGSSMYVINNPNNFATGSNGTYVGTRSTGTGYISSWTIPTASGLEWALIPAGVASSESYTYDGYYYTSSGTVAYIGGARSAWELHGPFFMYTDFTASSTNTLITTRLMYLP